MAKDLSQMRTEIWKWTDTNRDRVDEDILNRIINDVIADLARNADTLFNEFTVTIPTVVGQSDYSLYSAYFTDPFSRPFSLWYTGPDGERVRVTYVQSEEFQHIYEGNTGGDPVDYTIWGESLILGPTPSAVYDMTFRYYGYPAEIFNPSGTNKYFERAWDLVLYGSLTEVCKYLLEDQRLAIFQSDFNKRRLRFFIEQARAKTAGARSESHEPGWLED